MALPFFVRAATFRIATSESTQFAFGPFPAERRLMVRAIRLHVSFDDPSVQAAVNLNGCTSSVQGGGAIAFAAQRPLFAGPDASIPLEVINSATGVPAGFLQLDIPCYYLPAGDNPYVIIQLENAGAADITGFIAPVLDFDYPDKFEFSR